MLSPSQRATLLAAIKAVPSVNASRLAGDTFTVAAWCNGPAAGPVLAWGVNVSPETSDEAPDYSTFDSLVAGKRDSWRFFLSYSRNFTKSKVRKWITDVWGNATANSNAEAILKAGTISATNAQAAIGGAVKTTGTVSALDLDFVGSVSEDDVNWLVAQP